MRSSRAAAAIAEPPPQYRTEYQRDRDRIVHSTAFRRLVYKTQVFVNHEGDLYRTRLTHSLEVAQIARTRRARAARSTSRWPRRSASRTTSATRRSATPGQDALNECMRDFGGFEHNLQSLRVVDELEERYAEFPGPEPDASNARGHPEALLAAQCARSSATLGERFLERRQPGLEAQLANLADEIAYNNHDVDDGIRAGLITIEELRAVPLFGEYSARCGRCIRRLAAGASCTKSCGA